MTSVLMESASRGASTMTAGLPELANAIDVISELAEQSGKLAHKGAKELEMSETFAATFCYMVTYFHRLFLDGERPQVALANAAQGTAELTHSQLDIVRACAAAEETARP